MKKVSDFLKLNEVKDVINYHASNNIPINDVPFRPEAESYSLYFKEARKMYEEGSLKVADDDIVVLSRLQKGVEAMYQGKKVKLDSPTRISGGDKKYRVYTNSGKKDKDGNIKAIKIEWGAAGVQVKNDNDEARKNFLKRHQCDQKNDKTKAGWWACHVHLFHKELGLKSSKPW